ncbi:UNVERIFIED_ORG: hypothetical protein J2W19_001299 [Shinella zoogloeoides]|nr:hypothetical protein [Shinella zoogloeoides]
MQIDLYSRFPMQAPKQGYILKLDMRVKLAAPYAIRGTHRQPDQLCSQPTDPAVCGSDRKARAPPDTGRGLVDPDSPHNFCRFGRQRSDRRKGEGASVDFVMVTADEDALFVYKHLVSETRYPLKFPGFSCCPDDEFRADEGGVIHVAHAGILSFS